MPTSTFFNLPEEKRQRLMRSATEEFSKRPYGEVPLSSIIQSAGIPRGSFYQYFADKTDLFQFVLSQISQRMRGLIGESLDRCGGDLLVLPLALFDRAMEFLREDEEEARTILCIVQHNAALGTGQIWDVEATVRLLLERVDLTPLRLDGRGEICALLDLLLSSAGQAVGAACCHPAKVEICRTHLQYKVEIIRAGVLSRRSDKEASPC